MRTKSTTKMTILIMYALLIVLSIVFMLIGRYGISIKDVIGLITGSLSIDGSTAAHVLINIRFPRIIAAILVGSALAVSGATYQGVFKNPMVSPSLLGVSAGAGFGAALAIVLNLSGVLIQVFAFSFGIIAVALVYFLSSIVAKGNNKTLTIVLIGIVTSSLFTSLISLIKYIGDPLDDLPAITFWLMGSLSGVMVKDVAIVALPIVFGTAGLFIIKWRLNIMSLSDEEAMSLGLSINKIRVISVICSTLITASAVSVCGIIGWVGLVIPHIVRMMVGNDYKYVIPASIAGGGIYMLVIDLLSRSIFMTEIPLGILTSIIGTPVFVYIMLKRRKTI